MMVAVQHKDELLMMDHEANDGAGMAAFIPVDKRIMTENGRLDPPAELGLKHFGFCGTLSGDLNTAFILGLEGMHTVMCIFHRDTEAKVWRYYANVLVSDKPFDASQPCSMAASQSGNTVTVFDLFTEPGVESMTWYFTNDEWYRLPVVQ